MFDAALFNRSADVRGDYPRQLNEELAWFMGRYLVRYLKAKESAPDRPRVLIGRDGRISSPVLYRALIQGVAAEGGVPVPCGLASTDMICWGVGAGRYGAAGGAIVTASHNPPEYNGIKMFEPDKHPGALPGVRTVSPRDDLKAIFEADCGGADPEVQPGGGVFPFPTRPVRLNEEFVEWASRWAPDRAGFDEVVVIDPGNGVGSVFLDPLKKQLPKATVESIAAMIDGRFPSRPSNPGLAGACDALGEKVRELGASFGVALDGDADRVFMTDEKGEFIPGDHLLAAIVKTALEQNPGDPIVFVATCSWLLVETVRRFGGKPIVCKVGQDTVKWVMKETGTNFGGESSAHFNYADSYYQDSGLIALMGLWQSLHTAGTPLSEAVQSLEPWPQSGEINIRIESDDWSDVGRRVVERIRELHSTGDKANECYVLPLDEVSVFYPKHDGIATAEDLFPKDTEKDPDGKAFRYIHPDYSPQWWLNIRRSNNEPLMRVNVECRDESALKDRTRDVVKMARDLCTEIGGCATTVVNWGRVGALE